MTTVAVFGTSQHVLPRRLLLGEVVLVGREGQVWEWRQPFDAWHLFWIRPSSGSVE